MYEEFLKFPKDFAWGVATASYQIEGAHDADGKGKSIWDTFSHRSELIADGKNGDVTCDHYNRYKDDVDLMNHLNYRNYRLSLSWSRILTDGTKGSFNQKGLDFYDRLIDYLLEKNITPYVTLFHWDLPQALQDKGGGFANRETADHFVDYADIATKALGDRVKNWMTFNEPWVYSYCGHLFGCHAPGEKDLKTTLAVAHNIMLAHGKSIPTIRANVKDSNVGIVNNFAYCESVSQKQEDIDAARRWDLAFNKWFIEPLYKGAYPQEMVDWYGKLMPEIGADDFKHMQAKCDFMGLNYYTRRLVEFDPTNDHIKAKQVYRPCIARAEFEEFENNPEALYRVLTWLRTEYPKVPIIISENGTVIKNDVIENDGCVHDKVRVEYLRRHFAATWQAIQEGADIRGYLVWSFLDNYEWGFGFSKRFGLVYTDYENNLRRIVKDSGHFLSEVATKNGFMID